MKTKILITLLFIFILLIHTFTKITVDNISIILILLSFLPWFIQYIKSLEIAGIGKVEFKVDEKERKEIDKNADIAGLMAVKGIMKNQNQYTFYNYKKGDPKFALAGLRFEIENKLRNIALNKGINMTNADNMDNTIYLLIQNQELNANESIVIRELNNILDKAVHDNIKKYDDESLDWIFDLGSKLLANLNAKLSKN